MYLNFAHTNKATRVIFDPKQQPNQEKPTTVDNSVAK